MSQSKFRRYFVTFRPVTPLILGTGMDVQSHRITQKHIPGSVIRGSLGTKMYGAKGCAYNPILQNERASDPELDKIFGPGGVRFGPLYPAWDEGDFDKSLHKRVLDFIMIPLTAWTCKAEPGLNHEYEREDGEHITIDNAFRDPRKPGDMFKCKCGSRLERIRGYAVRVKADNQKGDYWVRVSPLVRERTRVGLNRQSATAEDGILHSVELVQPVLPDPIQFLLANPSLQRKQAKLKPLIFVGYWSMTEEQHSIVLDELSPFVEKDGFRVGVGACQSSGFGQGTLTVSRTPEPIPSDIELHQNGNMRIFALTTRSPVICLNRAGVACARLTPDVICEYFPNAPCFNLYEYGCYTERGKASGWAGLWGLPKPVRDCISAGSVFVYRTDSSIDELMPFFERLMTEGIGERLEEGFGQVDVNHAFHNRFGGKGGSK